MTTAAAAPIPTPGLAPVRNAGAHPHEFRAFLGLSMAAAAISIDLILPAFRHIRADFELAPGSAATAGLLTSFFLGLALGPLPLGLVADRVGRRPVILCSSVLYIAGAIATALLPSLGAMLWSRFVWGVGASGMRVGTTSMVRDRYSGADMAREMAFAMTVFMVVPVMAPIVGAQLLHVMSWRVLIGSCTAFGVLIALWSLRFPETLTPERRQPLQLRQIGVAARAIRSSRVSLAYSVALVALTGVFSSYLASSERMLDRVFHHGSWFPYYFAAVSICMGATSLTVGRHVTRVGLPRVITLATLVYALSGVVLAAHSLATQGRSWFWLFAVLMALMLSSHVVLMANCNAAAMLPVGHVAGTAGALMLGVSLGAGALIGRALDRAFDDTINPFSVSLAATGFVMVLCLRWALGDDTSEAALPRPRWAGAARR